MNAQATKTGLFVLAFISAVLNYAGFIQIIDSADWWLKALCLLTSVGVWVCLFLFWRYGFTIIPHLRMQNKRFSGWITILAGCVVIIALSTYWNVIAFTGKEVLRLANAENVTRAEQQFAGVLSATGGYASLIPQLEALSSGAFSLADGEEYEGAVTGARGKGGISETLRQIGTKVAGITASVKKVAKSGDTLKSQGKACLAQMRSATNTGFSRESTMQLSAGADCLNGVIADLGNTNASGGVVQAMNGLRNSIVLPVSIKTDRQRQALSNVLDGLQNQADMIASVAGAIPKVSLQPFQLERPNMASAVLLHWHSIIPAIATALAIDLLPLLLLILGVLLHRDGEQMQKPRNLWTAEELADAQKQLEAIRNPEATPLLTYQSSNIEKDNQDDDWWDVDDIIDPSNREG